MARKKSVRRGTTMREHLERLTGHTSPVSGSIVDQLGQNDLWRQTPRVTVAVLNELLLALAYETVSDDFFQWCFGRHPGGATRHQFEAGVSRFEQLALLRYGNIKFGFKTLSKRSTEAIQAEIGQLLPRNRSEYTGRNAPLQAVTRIPADKTFFLGELTKDAILKGSDQRLKEELLRYQQIGLANFQAYVCSDEMDVYVATSMRDVEDFFFVGHVVRRLFAKPALRGLKVRHFDPTQSYASKRIEKGLVEALMLRRARCTVYCAQTTETLGKDSELAVTLAMGKPVVVYVPRVEGNERRYRQLSRQAGRIEEEIFGRSLEVYYRRKLIERHARVLESERIDPSRWGLRRLEKELVRRDGARFEERAAILKEKHPLGVQVDLSTGVANGVLVVRTLTECANLLAAILTNRLTFRTERDEDDTIRLVERTTGCTYRLMVSDPILTNSFWNFYRPWISTPGGEP